MARGIRRSPPPDLTFEPAERAAIDAEAERIREALVAAGLRPQGPGFPFVQWRAAVNKGIVAGLPKGATWPSASVVAALAAFCRQREAPALYARIPFSHVLDAPRELHGVEAGSLDPAVARDLEGARALVPEFERFARALARAQPSDVSNWRLT